MTSTLHEIVATRAYAAKRAIINALRLRAAEGSLLADAYISYSDPGVFAEAITVYGTGVVFDQAGEDDVQDGDDILVQEVAVVGLHIRVEQAPLPDGVVDPVEFTDSIAEGLGNDVARLLASNRRLAGNLSIARIVGGLCDHYLTDTSVVSVLTLRISVESMI